MYYQDNNTEHPKVIYLPYSRNCQILWKKTGNKINKKYCSTLKLNGCGHYSLLVDITHYRLLKFLVEIKLQSSCQYKLPICQFRNLFRLSKAAIPHTATSSTT